MWRKMRSLLVADGCHQHRSPRRMAWRNATGPPEAHLAARGLASARRVPLLGTERSRSELGCQENKDSVEDGAGLLCQKRVGEESNLGRRGWFGGRGVRGIEWAGGEERRLASSTRIRNTRLVGAASSMSCYTDEALLVFLGSISRQRTCGVSQDASPYTTVPRRIPLHEPPPHTHTSIITRANGPAFWVIARWNIVVRRVLCRR